MPVVSPDVTGSCHCHCSSVAPGEPPHPAVLLPLWQGTPGVRGRCRAGLSTDHHSPLLVGPGTAVQPPGWGCRLGAGPGQPNDPGPAPCHLLSRSDPRQSFILIESVLSKRRKSYHPGSPSGTCNRPGWAQLKPGAAHGTAHLGPPCGWDSTKGAIPQGIPDLPEQVAGVGHWGWASNLDTWRGSGLEHTRQACSMIPAVPWGSPRPPPALRLSSRPCWALGCYGFVFLQGNLGSPAF